MFRVLAYHLLHFFTLLNLIFLLYTHLFNITNPVEGESSEETKHSLYCTSIESRK